MKSERTWTEVHRRYAPMFLFDGMLFAVSGAVAVIGSATSLVGGGAAREVVGAATVVILVVTVIGGVFATVHARRLNREVRLGEGAA